MKVSAILSIHNRSKLFRRALDSYAWQSMEPHEFELVIVDDMSSEDLSLTYRHLIGLINIVHVRIDHTKHRVFKERNPGWAPGDPFQNWFHTPAISINVGAHVAKGAALCLCHPEILHAPANFDIAYNMLIAQGMKHFIFGQTYLGTQEMNATIERDSEGWSFGGWDAFLSRMGGRGKVPKFGPTELYWYTSFLPRDVVVKVGGVDFAFLNGVAGEDDDFKERVKLAGWTPYFEPAIEGFHQDHSDEKGHRDRSTKAWEEALNRNRALLFARLGTPRPEFGPAPCPPGFPMPANGADDWTAADTIDSIVRYTV